MPADAPGVVLIASQRDPLRLGDRGLIDALGPRVRLTHVPASSPLRHSFRAFTHASAALAGSEFELVHILDPRFAPVGHALRRRFGVPVTVSITTADVTSRHPWDRLSIGCARRFDEAFATDQAVSDALRLTTPALRLSMVAPAASELPWPSPRDVADVARALRGVRPGRAVVGVPWPANRNDFRWFRDLIQPALAARPVCLLFGVRSRREARWMIHSSGRQSDYRLISRPLRAGALAAIARAVDAFAVPAPSGSERSGLSTDLALALAVGGAPVVSGASSRRPVFAHEDNAFLPDPDDERAFASTLDSLLALPAVQRHFLGEEFARFTLERWPWDAAAEVYADRFAALVGRPSLPVEWRAA